MYEVYITMKKILLVISSLIFLISAAYSQLCPPYHLGPDTVIGCGASVTLQAPAGWGNYQWSNGSQAVSITVSQTGAYWCKSIDTLSNVVVNGDFSQGQTGFQSNYIPGTGGTWGLLSNPGTYAVTSNPNLVHTNFPVCYDHTVGNNTGSMLVMNGSSVFNQQVWYQTVNVQPNTNYIFSVWFTSVDPSSPAILRFSVNNTQLGNPITLTSNTCFWQNFYTTWNSGTNTTATISILNQNTAGGGNDFAIDDILFAPICVMADTLVVSHPPTPVVSVTGGDTICPGDSITLSASSNTPGSVFNWNPVSSTATDIRVSPSADTWYAVQTGFMNCWSAWDSVKVSLPVPLSAQINGTPAVCPQGSAHIDVTLSGGWNTLPTVWIPGYQTGNTLIVSPPATQTYGAIVSDQCSSDTLYHQVVVYPDPSPAFTVSQSGLCVPFCTDFNFTSATTAQTVTWDFGDNTAGNGLTPNHCYGNAGTYDVSVAVTDINGCSGTYMFPAAVVVYPLPQAAFTVDPPILTSLNPLLNFSDQSSGATVFNWDLGDGTTSTDANPSHTYIPGTILTDYITIQLIVANQYGCSDTVYRDIQVQNLTTFYMPNAFTPNNDGVNDYYFPKGYGIGRMYTQIYNRWGELVFSSQDMYASWDGKDQRTGDLCQEGVYVYVVDIQDQYGKEQRYMEHINLIR